MADVSFTPAQLSGGVLSEDVVVGSTNGHSITTGQTFEVLAEGNDDILFVIKYSGTTTVTFNAGDKPPSPKADKGSKDYAGTNATVKLVVLEKGRHIQDGVGKIEGSNTGSTVIMSAYRLPPGFIAPLVTYNGILNQ